jgi:hypothetical protein
MVAGAHDQNTTLNAATFMMKNTTSNHPIFSGRGASDMAQENIVDRVPAAHAHMHDTRKMETAISMLVMLPPVRKGW